MEHNRKQKLLIIVALIVGIASLSVGFAAFSTTLNISSSASVTPSSDTFKVKFSTSKDSLIVDKVAPSSKTSGIATRNGVIDNSTNPTIKGLYATFTSPGQYVEYTFYARNEGEYTAYLNSIIFLGDKTCNGEDDASAELVSSACESIIITATIGDTTYTETTPIEGHILSKGEGEQIKIRLEYLSTGTAVDGMFVIKFPNVSLIYSSINDFSIQPDVIKTIRLESGDLNTAGSIVSIGDEQFYVIGQEDGDVKLLSMYNLYVGNIVTADADDGDLIVTLLSESIGIQDISAIGYREKENNNGGLPYIGTVAFSASSQQSLTYNGSTVEEYVNHYRSYLELLGVNINEARLISLSELDTLGCNSSNNTCSGAPTFVYKTSYWTMEAWGNTMAYAVFSYGVLGPDYATRDDGAGVRPVIEVPLSEFE